MTITLESTGIACYPKQLRYKTWLELSYYAKNDTTGSVAPSKQRLQDLSEFYRITTREFTIPCTYFDQAGFYKLNLRTNLSATSTVATSEWIQVTWSEEYKISFQRPSVFPCSQGLTISYRYPKCILLRDRIRLFGRKLTAATSVASAAIFHYVLEKRVERGRNSITFPCQLFSDVYVEYCFVYVSVARRGGVNEVYSACIPTYGKNGKIEIFYYYYY